MKTSTRVVGVSNYFNVNRGQASSSLLTWDTQSCSTWPDKKHNMKRICRVLDTSKDPRLVTALHHSRLLEETCIAVLKEERDNAEVLIPEAFLK